MCIVHFVQFEFLPTKQAETYLEIYVPFLNEIK